MDSMNGTKVEYERRCPRCHTLMYQFSYGAYENCTVTKWAYYENALFGHVDSD
jgi:hypothetical protein